MTTEDVMKMFPPMSDEAPNTGCDSDDDCCFVKAVCKCPDCMASSNVSQKRKRMIFEVLAVPNAQKGGQKRDTKIVNEIDSEITDEEPENANKATCKKRKKHTNSKKG